MTLSNLNSLSRIDISTHTLTWSVTYRTENVFDSIPISTHTLTWSVTITFVVAVGCFRHFNSHAHVERDHVNPFGTASGNDFNSHAHVERDRIPKEDVKMILISTHTLTWSVTQSEK